MLKHIYVLIGLGVLLVAGLLVAPGFFDWNTYKPQITAAVKDALDRELRIVGDISLAILPSPALSVRQVSLENVEGAENGEMIALDEVEVHVDVSALLAGKIAITSVRLIRPVIALEITKDGKTSWDIKLPGDAPSTTASTPSTATSTASSDFAVDLSLDSLLIEDAVISYADARSGLVERISGLTTEIAADSVYGPFRAEGRMTTRGIPLSFSFNVGRFTQNQPLPVKLQIGHDETSANFRFVGKLSELNPDAALSGKVEVSAPDVATMARSLGAEDLPPLVTQALSMDAEISASTTEFGVNKLSLQFGDMSFAGAIQGSLKPTPTFDIVLNSSHVDIDHLLSSPVPQTQVAAAGDGRPDVAETKIVQPSTAEGANTSFTLPAGMTATFDFGIETASYKGGIVRNVALRGVLDEGAVALQTLSADLPGNSNVALTGRVKAADGLPQFTGNIAAGSDNFRSLLQWLGVAPADLPSDRLQKFSLKSKILATPKAASITNISIRLDASRISGDMALESRDKPGIGLRLAIDKLNLDAYLSKDGKKTGKKLPAGATKPEVSSSRGPVETPPEADPSPAATAALNDLFDALDANVELTAGRLTVAGETARQVKLNLTIFERAITLREASLADFAGLSVYLAGTVSAKGDKPAFSIDHAIALRDPARFARFLSTSLPTSPARLGKVSSNGRLEGNLSGLKTDISLKAIGATTRIRGALTQPLANPSVDLQVSLKHPELAAFIQKFSADYRPAARKLGPLSLNTTVHGTAASLTVDNIDIKAGPVAATGAIKTDLAGKRRKIDLNLKTSEVLLDLFLPPSPPPSTRQTRSLLASGGARETVSRDRGGIPAQRWSTVPIALPMATDIDADAQIEMAALTISDISLKTPKVKAVIRNGRLAVESFTASLFGGVVSGKAVVQPSGRNGATLASELSVDKVDSRLAVKALTGHDRVQGPLSFKANIATEGNSEASLVSGLNGNASVSGQAQVLLKKSERNQIRAVSVGANLLAGLLGGKVGELQRLAPLTQLMASLDQAFGRNPAQLSGDIRITRGVLRTDNLKLSGQGHVATTSTTVDLPRWDFNLTTELVDDPRQMPLVMFSATGPIDAPSKTRVGGRLLGQGAASAGETATNPLQQILPGLLGGSTGGSPQTEGQNKVNPGKLLEGIFKQFQR